MSGKRAFTEPVAIVGVGGIFPGARSLDVFWNIIARGEDTNRPVPEGRWILNPAEIQHPTAGTPDRVYTDRGCFVEPFKLKLDGLQLPPELVETLDPVFHLLLEAGRSAFQSARLETTNRSRIGVILGNIALPTDASSDLCEALLLPVVKPASQPESQQLSSPLNRYVAGLPAGILAKALGLSGGSYTLDAACASSLYALKLACDELLAGRADAMLTGGLSRPDSLYTQMGFCQLHALSLSGKCSPFDAAGDGLIVGEGAGVLVLKRLSDARHDGDHIHAVIRGIGLSNDLDGNLLSPSSEGQLRALRSAYEQAGWTPEMVDLIECHATGTPVGDAVEFASLRRLWDGGKWEAGQCTLGAVKANIGHLLTAAGSASLIKVLLALKHDTLPATANFHQPAEKVPLPQSPFRILKQSLPWKRRAEDVPRRAAVNGFGFGGINAHVLIEEWLPKTPHVQAAPIPAPVPVAIVGMAATVGRWTNLRTFQERVLGGGNAERPVTRKTWRGMGVEEPGHVFSETDRNFPGYYLDDLAIPLNRYRIPPKELGELLPQQALMLEVARAALLDAKSAKTEPARTGVFVGLGLDLRTTDFHLRWAMLEQGGSQGTNGAPEIPPLTADRTLGSLAGIIASRIAKEFHFGGPSHTVASEDCSGMRALEIAVRALQQNEVDQALAGAVEVTGDLRALLATNAVRPYSHSGAARPFDISADGTIPGEGAVSVVLKRLADAQRDGDRIYAVVRGIGATSGAGVGEDVCAPEVYRQALQRAYQEAEVDPASVEYVEAHGSGRPAEDRSEIQALAAFFGAEQRATPCRIGSVKADVGHTGAASGLVSVVKTCLALYQEIIPPLRELRQPLPELANARHVSIPTLPQYWVRNRAAGPRRAGVTSLSIDGNCMHMVLEAVETHTSERSIAGRQRPLGAYSEALFTLQGETPAELSKSLAKLREYAAAPATNSLEFLARQWWVGQSPSIPQPHRLALVAQDAAQLLRLIAAAQEVVNETRQSTSAEREPGQDRDRIFYYPPTARVSGGIAFVFPGSGSHFAEMGRELALHWPEILRAQDGQNQFLASQMFADRFWNANTDRASTMEHCELICGQVALGTLVSDLAISFGLKPEAAIGYSLGESTALFALRAWQNRDEMLQRVTRSSLFRHDLTGTTNVLRQVWRVPDSQAVEWKAGLVDRSAEDVRAAMAGRAHLYILIVNTPKECVIGGDAAELDLLVKKLGCHWFPFEGVSTVHCELLHPVEQAYRNLHLFDTRAPVGMRFFSGGWGRAYVPDRETAADAIVAQGRGTIDFPRVIEAAYDSGIRIFLEMGPGNSCSRMISQILDGRPHVARSLCASPSDALLGVLRTLANVFAHGAAVDLQPLYGGAGWEERFVTLPDKNARCVRIAITGAPLKFIAPANVPAAKITVSESLAANPAPVPAMALTHAADAPDPFEVELLKTMTDAQTATLQAHEVYLDFSKAVFDTLSQSVHTQLSVIAALAAGNPVQNSALPLKASVPPPAQAIAPPVALDRAACLEFARGTVAKVLGAEFAPVDAFPSRVRLPDEPLMLVDRILEIHGEARSMTHGRVITEHDILPGAWYLDCGRIPTCIAVEAGQADLFLSGYLGIDFETRGLAVYRLLDARVCFHRPLPGPGAVIHYDIRIERFFRQASTWLFRFNFEATVNGEPLLTMTDGCAGFFSAAELAGGRGIVRTAMDLQAMPGKRATDWHEFVPLGIESYSAAQLDALRAGDLAGCFGPQFAGLPLQHPVTLPTGLMQLVHRVPLLDPCGGRFGLGLIRGEADIQPKDWFLTCHFVDDRVMPGTLMFECCLHTLRVYLLRLGWVADAAGLALEPVPGVVSQLKCRGQVLETTRVVTYEVSVKEIGYRPEPYVIADALMYADGKPIVEITNMSLRYAGVTLEVLKQTWGGATLPRRQRALYDADRILAFAVGKPSVAFGAPYEIFDERRRIARLPGPPYQFLDRITEVQGEPFKMVPGGIAVAEYDVPSDAWYFAENRQGDMPFAVLLEIALQPCGWLAAYVGSALTSDVDLSFRNLGGTGIQHAPVFPGIGTLTTRVKLTRVSSSAGMIIQWFDFEVRAGGLPVYQGDTYFGFFPQAALAHQEGIHNAQRYVPSPDELARRQTLPYPAQPPYPGIQLRMVDEIESYIPDGGPKQLGFLRGIKKVNPEEWFFKAHFFQDPVVPGSLGLESFLQLLKFAAVQRWGDLPGGRWETVAVGARHEWIYRGQIIPPDNLVTIEAVITEVNDAERSLKADGFLSVDGRVIYGMKEFTLRARPGTGNPG